MRKLIFGLGVVLLLNPYIRPLGEHTRVMDLMPALLLPLLILRALKNDPNDTPKFFGAALIIVAEIPWLVGDRITLGLPLPSYSTRWLGLVPLALTLCLICERERNAIALTWGIVAGASLNSFLLFLQTLGFSETLIRIGLAYPEIGTYSLGAGTIRFSGLHGHPNAAAAVVSLCIPAAIVLVGYSRRGPLLIFYSLAVCVLAAFCTYSRSSFLVAVVILILWLVSSRSRKGVALASALISAGLLVGVYVSSPELVQRFALADDKFAESNAQLRWETTTESLALVLQNPLGLGSSFHEFILPASTHNAFTALALYGGWPIAALVIFGIGAQAFRKSTTGLTQNWLALQVIGLSFFEEHFANPTFIAIALWLTCTSLAKVLHGAGTPAWRLSAKRNEDTSVASFTVPQDA